MVLPDPVSHDRAGPAPAPAVPGYVLRAPVPGAARPGEGQWLALRPGDQEQVRVVTLPVAGGCAQALSRVAEVAAVRHRALAPVHDAVPCEPGLALVLGWRARTRLSRVLARRGRLTEAEVAGLLVELGGLLAHLHRDGVVHGGLSTEEVWLQACGRAVVGDLALQAVRPRAGRVPAPELAEGFACSPDSDVWDLAALACHCLDGRPPRLDRAPEHRSGDRDISTGTYAETGSGTHAETDSGTGSELRELLAECLTADPARRPAAEEVADRAPEAVRRTAGVWHGPPLDAPRQGPLDAPGQGEAAAAPAAAGNPGGSRRRVLALSALAVPLFLTAVVLHGQDSSGSAHQQEVASPAAATVTAGPGEAAAPRPDPGSSATAAGRATATTDVAATTAAPPPAATVSAGALLQELLDARARAWRGPDPRGLDEALAPGSPARRHDEAALTEAMELGLAYPGLAFTVERAEVVREVPRRRELEAEVRQGAYRITGGAAGADGRAEPARVRTVRVVLTGGDGPWRIHDWRPADGAE